MCGISGIWNLNGQSVRDEDIDNLNSSISHRGPDGHGKEFFLEKQLVLAHRRLSILDLSEAGHQPMFSFNQRYCVVYNGEIYNFLELRDELKSKGYEFKTDSDTEVLLNAWDCWGIDAFHKFNGMWAFALWDNLERSLILCRDRFGIKPLYYIHSSNKYFAFCSETNGFGQFPGFDKKLNLHLTKEAAIDPFIPDSLGQSIWDGIEMVKPGHYLKLQYNAIKEPEQKRWYSIFENVKPETLSYKDQVEKFKELFFDSINLRLRSDVDIATALSGGVDSSAVFCSLSNLFNGKIEGNRRPNDWQKAFVMCFPGEENDEQEFAREVVKFTHGSAEYINIGNRVTPEAIVNSTVHLDAINTTPLITADGVYEEIYKHGYRISLDGHGADELLYGYRNSIYDVYNDELKFGSKNGAQNAADILWRMYLPELQRDKQLSLNKEIDQNFLLLNKLKRLVSTNNKNEAHFTNIGDKVWQQEYMRLSPQERIGFRDFYINPLPGILRNFDKASMKYSVESRMPFMDYRLVEFVNSLPLQSKINGGKTKAILRDAMKGVMPENIRNRTFKVGFIANMSSWFSGELSTWLRDVSSSTEFLQSSYFDGKMVFEQFEPNLKEMKWTDRTANAMWYYLNVHIITSAKN